MRTVILSAFFLLVLQVDTAASQKSIRCPSGKVQRGSKCQDCPPGTYRRAGESSGCRKCPSGSFNPHSGAVGRDLCRPCFLNTYAPFPGATSCKPCPPGSSARRGATKCLSCGPGFQISYTEKCERCEAGKYSNGTANLECESCPFPLNGPPQSTSIASCTACPIGSAGYDCGPCNTGSFGPVIGERCRECPPGTVSSRGGATKCRKCPSGTFAKGRFAERCAPCPPGMFSKGPGATVCRPIGSTACPTGLFENVNGDCERCRFSYKLNRKKKRCEKCPPGEASLGGKSTTCKKCRNGKVPDDDIDTARCICPQGSFIGKNGKCELCPAGTGGNFGNVFDRSGCIDCDFGSFSDKPGSLSCSKCPFGSISNKKERATGCIPCPAGTMPDIDELRESERCVSVTTRCPAGYKRTLSFGDFDDCKEIHCPLGTPAKDVGKVCLPCEPGYALNSKGKCRQCPRNAVSDGGVIDTCTKCTNGLFRGFFDPSRCACDGSPSDGKGIQNGKCKKCPPGSVGDPNYEECLKCPPGKFSSEFGKVFCTHCPPGKFSSVEGSASCKSCPSGSIPEKRRGSAECVSST